jgi:CheY-like chemotaxis protein
MGGRIDVESAPGVGTRFSFALRFPLATRPDVPLLAEVAGKVRVLVVDDHQMSRVVLGRMLEKFGFTVEAAASGDEALRLAGAAGTPFGLVLMDWRMPGIDGLETVRRLRRDPRYRNTPVVMVTSAEFEEVRELQEAGIHRYLFKPVRSELLLEILREVFAQSPVAEAARFAGRGRRVLLVEDNEFNQDVARELLEGEGLVVDVAGNGRQALAALEGRTYDLVLMDMQMPVMDGITATRAIRAEPRFAGLPIVAMTANALPAERQACLEAGMNDFVTKPVMPEDLKRRWPPACPIFRRRVRKAGTGAGRRGGGRCTARYTGGGIRSRRCAEIRQGQARAAVAPARQFRAQPGRRDGAAARRRRRGDAPVVSARRAYAARHGGDAGGDGAQRSGGGRRDAVEGGAAAGRPGRCGRRTGARNGAGAGRGRWRSVRSWPAER